MARPETWLWRFFWLLAGLQIVDLLTTYLALATGHAYEGNVFVQRVIRTPGAPVLKGAALVFLGGLVVMSVRRGRPVPRRLLAAVEMIVLLYVGIVANNLWVLTSR